MAKPKPAPKKNPTYAQFVGTHGGKSTKNLASAWENRFGPEKASGGIDARNVGGVQAPGNTGIAQGDAFALPKALQPPVGGAAPTPPSTTGDIPTAQPPDMAQAPDVGQGIETGATDPTIADAVGDFVGGRGGSAPATPPVMNPATQLPGDPAGSYRAFEGAPPQTGPTTEPVQDIEELERDPALDLLLRKYKGGAG